MPTRHLDHVDNAGLASQNPVLPVITRGEFRLMIVISELKQGTQFTWDAIMAGKNVSNRKCGAAAGSICLKDNLLMMDPTAPLINIFRTSGDL